MAFAESALKLGAPTVVDMKKRIASLAKAKAADVLRVTPDQVIVRKIDPQDDLGLSDKVWSFVVNAGWNEVVSKVIPSNKVIYVYGFKVLHEDVVDDVSFIRLYKGNDLVYEDNIQEYYDGEKYQEIMLAREVEYLPNDKLRLQIYAKSGASSVTIKLAVLGYVGEKLGERITSPLLHSNEIP